VDERTSAEEAVSIGIIVAPEDGRTVARSGFQSEYSVGLKSTWLSPDLSSDASRAAEPSGSRRRLRGRETQGSSRNLQQEET
jgi:hypothetical protein